MKNLAIHAVIVLLALACFADAFRMQSKVKTMTKDDQMDDACVECVYQCGYFILPEVTDDYEARQKCVLGAYEGCCSQHCTTCPFNSCSLAIKSHCQWEGYLPYP